MKSVLKYILLTAIRDRLYIGLLVVLIGAFGISTLLGSTSLVEQAQTSIVYISGSSRMIFAIGIILFTCFYIRRSFDNKEVEFILSKSISRHNFILAYILGFTLVASFIFIPITTILLISKVNIIGLQFWLLTIFAEILILISFALLSSLILKNVVSSILATLGFYILARMMAFFVLTIEIPHSSVDFNSWQAVMKSLLKLLSFIFPRLDLFAQSDWLIYGVKNSKEVIASIIQSAIYIPLLIFMSFFDFNKKQF